MRSTHVLRYLALLALATAGCSNDAANSGKSGDGGKSADGGRSGDAGKSNDGAVAPSDAATVSALPDLNGSTIGATDSGTIYAADMRMSAADLGPECPGPPMFNFTCDPKNTATCPAGFCVLNQCVAAQIDPARYFQCGNGLCDKCEDAQSCPADCASPPAPLPPKVYDDPNTLTIWVHGFSNHSADSLKNQVYGAVAGCGDLGDQAKTYGESAPCGSDPANDKAPNQIVSVEYYGAVAPAWMTPADVMEVEQYPYIGGATGLQRYGLIVAKFIKWRMAYTGATHVNLACHSMGCLLSRYIIENDVEQLASQSLISRWVTAAGVVAGAQLARLYNNPLIEMGADKIGLAVDDFALMDPSYVQTYAASYDHQLWEGNNPLFAGILIHHVGATYPKIGQAFNIELLNLDNPQQMPNDGIMYTFDEMFASQSKAASVQTPSGAVMSATHSYIYVGHMDAPSGDDFGAPAIAALFHRRKVVITLDSVSLIKDHEFSLATPLEVGVPPAEVVAETEVSYDPYTQPKYGTKTLVDEDHLDYHSPELYTQAAGSTMMPSQTLYAGPIFDDQTALHLKLTLTEADYYARYSLSESLLADVSDKKLLGYESDVQLMDQEIPISDDGATGTIKVQVIEMY